ncbi:MAG: hypothetical protein ABEK50_12665, partial [bacterium]
MFEWVFRPEAWIAFFSLTALEIVLGVDNILFISILSENLPEEEMRKLKEEAKEQGKETFEF